MWDFPAFPRLFPLALSLSTKQGLLILKRTSVARSQKNKSWCVSCNLISNKTSNKTSCTIFNIRLKYLEMIINVISKISYKMITLTWYKSFKQNIIKIKCNINFKIRRTNYGKSTFNTIKYSFIYDINCISRISFFCFSIRISRRRYIA